jgi:hypothetical protein
MARSTNQLVAFIVVWCGFVDSITRGEGPDRAQLEKEFAESLSGAVLTGTYSVTGTEGAKESPPKSEKYTISKVTKLKDDFWLIQSRIQYGQHDVTVPLTLEIKWAGDTPIITMTDMAVPGLGTFTARVMFYRGRYAGTWQHDKVGGHLWGTIEKPKVNDAPSKTNGKP